MEDLKAKYHEWVNFVATREAERAKLSNPENTAGLKKQINDKKSEVMRAQAELQMLQAQLVLSFDGETPYRKTVFDMEWAGKKSALKAEVEALVAEEIQRGVSIPKIMKSIGCRNVSWLYAVRDNIEQYRGASKEEMAGTKWEWSDVIAVHRYALACAPESSEWAFVMMHGALDTEYEGDYCVFDFKTGHFISGNRALFDDVTEGAKAQRSQMLAEILEGVYSKKTRRDTNPYFSN